MDVVAHVQPVGPAPINRRRAAADERGVSHLSPQQRPVLLHALRTCLSIDAAPYLNQAWATNLGGMSELDAALHLLHQLDKDLESGEVTIFLECAGETPCRPRLTNPVYDSTIRPPHAPSCATSSSWIPPGALPPHQPPLRLAAGPTHTCPLPSPGPAAPTTGDRSSGKTTRGPPCSSSSS